MVACIVMRGFWRGKDTHCSRGGSAMWGLPSATWQKDYIWTICCRELISLNNMTDLVSIQTEMSNTKRINIPINYRITSNIKRTQCSVTERAASSVRKGRERGWGGGGEGREVAPGRLVRPYMRSSPFFREKHESFNILRLQNSRFGKAGSALSVILECEARDPHTPAAFLHSLQTFRSNMVRRSRSPKIRLFCSLQYPISHWSKIRYPVPEL